MSEAVQYTTCPYCGVGCGVRIEQADTATDGTAASMTVSGDLLHPANLGRLCIKGSSLSETLGSKDRLLYPEIGGVRADWSRALKYVADGFSDVIEKYGSDAVAFYVSGQLLTEDYYVANKLMKGFIGSANIDTNSRLCMSSAVAAYKRAFGEDLVPGSYEDLEHADLLVVTGSNLAWAHPVVYQRIKAARENNPDKRIVVIDPRKTASCEIADLHLPLRPGSDAFLFSGLLTWLAGNDALDRDYIACHTEQFDQVLELAAQVTPSIDEVARRCELLPADVEAFYRLVQLYPRMVTLFSMGINQSSSGTDKGNAIINVHLATGRIGKPGANPFSMTGQPNAMGGREVGGLANQLAAHMDLGNEQHRKLVSRFWKVDQLPDKPGLTAVELFRKMEAGQIKAVWIMGTNPAVSLPDTNQVKRALDRCDLVVVSDCVKDTDTADYAEVKLPALGWSEKDGTVTNSERRISRQRAFLPAPGQAKPDWWIISAVARQMGFASHFDYQCTADIFREHAALSAYENHGERFFNLEAMTGISDREYDQMIPLQWPVTWTSRSGTDRLFEDGVFPTRTGRASFVPVAPAMPKETVSEHFPLVLNSGRIRDQWHTMTRTGRAPRLFQHISEPFVEVHPTDLVEYGLEEGGLARVSNEQGQLLVRVVGTESQRRGSLFIPMHWNQQFTAQGTVDTLVRPHVDPVSAQPEFKQVPVMISPWQPAAQGVVISLDQLRPDVEYWACRPLENGASMTVFAAAEGFSVDALHQWCNIEGARWISLSSDEGQEQRLVGIDRDGRLRFWGSIVTAGSALDQIDESWLAAQFEQAAELTMERFLGRSEEAARGAVICSCHQVREGDILEAIDQGAGSVEEIGIACQAGTGCGSCQPELTALLQKQALMH